MLVSRPLEETENVSLTRRKALKQMHKTSRRWQDRIPPRSLGAPPFDAVCDWQKVATHARNCPQSRASIPPPPESKFILLAPGGVDLITLVIFGCRRPHLLLTSTKQPYPTNLGLRYLLYLAYEALTVYVS